MSKEKKETTKVIRLINPSKDEIKAMMDAVEEKPYRIFARIESKTKPLWFNFGW